MSIEIFKRLGWFCLLWMVQVLVLNHVHLFDVATPLLYVYFCITFRRNMPRWIILFCCFAMGFAVDIFSNTPGLAAGSMTLVALLQPYLLELFVPRDSVDDLEVSPMTLGFGKFTTFASILILVYCLVFFALEAFTFFNWTRWLACAGSSAVLTLALILAIESVFRK